MNNIRYRKRNMQKAVMNMYRYAPQFTIYKIHWEFHKGDSDLWPSWLHAHSRDGKYKLDALNGNVWEITTEKKIGKADDKELQKLLRNNKFKKFMRERKKHLEQNIDTSRLKLPQLKAEKTIFVKQGIVEDVFSTDIAVKIIINEIA